MPSGVRHHRSPVRAPGGAPVQALPPEEARDRIVDAATAEFGEKGFEGARTGAIASRAGVNQALLYYYFGGKLDLYRAIVRTHFQAIGDALEAAAANPSEGPATLRPIVDAFLAEVTRRPHFPAFIVRELLVAGRHLGEDEFQLIFRTSRPVREVVARGIARGEYRAVPPLYVHFLLVGALNFFWITQAARARAAGLLGEPALPASPESFAEFAVQTIEGGLVRSAGPGSAGAGPAPPPFPSPQGAP